MAIFYGDDWRDVIRGTNASDVIYGFGGDDDIYGNDGDDDVDAGWGYDLVYGDAGDDYLNGGTGYDDLYGGAGQDRILGGDGYDVLFGQSGNDDLYGGSSYDDLYGGSGLDYLNGGSSDDWLDGGSGRDWLVGGTGVDVFVFNRGSSGIRTTSADTIADWNASRDWIETPIWGTSTNYREASTTATSIAEAAAQAESTFTSARIAHVFLYNRTADQGYLLSDLNNDNRFETGVVLRGAGSAGDMSYLFIV